MLLQTNSYIVPKDKRAEHARLLRRFRASLAKLGCDSFEVYEQVGSNWTTGEPTGRYVQIMRFRDRRHQLAVQAAERSDPVAQAIIAEFCQLINFPYQQQQGLFAVGFYNSVLPVAPTRPQAGEAGAAAAGAAAGAVAAESDLGEHTADTDAEAHAGEGLNDDVHEGAGDVEGDVELDAEAHGGADELAAAADDDAVAETEYREVPAGEAEGADSSDDVAGELTSAAVPSEAGGSDAAAAPDAPESAAEVADRLAGAEVEPAEDVAVGGFDEMGALLDAHAEMPGDAASASEGPQPAGDANGLQDALDTHETRAAEERPDGIDALDLDALDLPDDSAAEPQPASDSVAR